MKKEITTEKLPVFFHIPKNAGTYTNDVLWFSLRYHVKTKNARGTMKRLICLDHLGHEEFNIFLYDFEDDYFKNENFTTINNFVVSCDFSFFAEYYLKNNNLKIYSVTINAAGFKSADKICNYLEQNANKDLKKFIILREVLSRECSLFKYLKSDLSKHEKTHGSIAADNLSDYLTSNGVSDSWIIRSLLNIQNDESITDDHYNTCIEKLNEFEVASINTVDSLINKILMECYSYNKDTVFNCLKSINKDKFNVNKNSSNSSIPNLDKCVIFKFRERTKYDSMIYDHFNHKF